MPARVSNHTHPAAPRILFLHLPKTAGTALRELLAHQYGEQRVTRPLATVRLDEALIQHADADVICGHFQPEQGDRLPADRLVITVLREPISRFLSDYRFRRHTVVIGAVDQRVRELTLEDYIHSLGETDIRGLNTQTQLLFPLGTDAMKPLPWPERTIASCRALDSMDLVGVQDEIDDFVALLGARLGWPGDARLARINISRQGTEPPLSAAARRRLKDLLAPDLEVYAHALGRFRELRRAAIHGASWRFIEPAPSAREALVTAPRDIGDHRVELQGVTATGAASGLGLVMVGEWLHIAIELIAHEEISALAIGFLIRDERGLPVFGTDTWQLGYDCTVTPGRHRVSFGFLNRSACGAYTIDASLTHRGSPNLGCHHLHEQAAHLDVYELQTPYFRGRVMMDPKVEFATTSPHGRIEIKPGPVDAQRLALSVGRRNLPLSDFRAQLRPLNAIGRVATGTELLVELELAHTGSQAWPSDGVQAVCISYHWYAQDGTLVEYDGVRSHLPRDISPGETVRLTGFVRAPYQTGRMRLCWTLVQEGVAWFDLVEPASTASMDVTVS